jgi:transcriptional regulator with XRE-family HTH domain
MPRITPQKEQDILAALGKDAHASRVARTLGDVSYATVWRVARRAGIALTEGRRTMGRPLPPERRARVEAAVAANPGARQQDLARQTGVSRSTVSRVKRALRAGQAPAR